LETVYWGQNVIEILNVPWEIKENLTMVTILG